MKTKMLLYGYCVLPLILGAVLILPQSSRNAKLAATRAQELETMRANLEQAKANAVARELDLTRLSHDAQELVRLRNEVRELREDNQQLSKQVRSVQAELQRVEGKAQTAQDTAQDAQGLATDLAEAQTEQFANASLLAEYQDRINAIVDTNGGLATLEGQAAAACINNLRRIDDAKLRWALEKGKTASATPTWPDLAAYMQGGLLPVCPAGGVYTLNAVNIDPSCSIPGHLLPPPEIPLAGR